MGGLFSKPKKPKLPPAPAPPPPPPEPEPAPEKIVETGEGEIKKARRRSGYQRTIITGALVPTGTGKKSVLG